ncbi:transketolase [Candidatus Saccharibacteria bacterium]|jgi:transketolase|nr:transketolase [Candidatus Saccharibacteria bacterium]HPW47880.1 transketolase [Candidatus Saccharibacteria bacterium]
MKPKKDKNYSLEELEQIARSVRKEIISMLERAGSGHPGGSLGLADIMTALYFSVLKHNPKKPNWSERDILVLSNGHTVPAQYAAMALAGYFDRKELETLRKLGSRLQGHPERVKLPGMETTSGPLGCGLSQAIGMALAHRLNQQPYRWVYCIMGDGELNEGNVWEAAMLAPKYELYNVVGIIDRNNIQIDGPAESVMPLEDLRAKWEAFNWHVIEINGNDIEAIIDACAMARAIVEKPVMIIAHTIPGKGVSFMEYDYRWHGVAPDREQAQAALQELRNLQSKDI